MSSRNRGRSPPALYTYEDEEPKTLNVQFPSGKIHRMNRQELEVYYQLTGLSPEQARRKTAQSFEEHAPRHGPPGYQPERSPPRNGGRPGSARGSPGPGRPRPGMYEDDYPRGRRRGSFGSPSFDYDEAPPCRGDRSPPRQDRYGCGPPPGSSPRRGGSFYEDDRPSYGPPPGSTPRRGGYRDDRPSYGPPPGGSPRHDPYFDGPPPSSSRRGGNHPRYDAMFEDDDDEGPIYYD
ncbi:hypothetical protein BJ875DRAFT_486248 [Amylocarpus encephaloides]|uniref:Uncharacterized protein n=1 Tax=Amylocarpus encephaloides TaxID=45428 RepID=A0A9P7YFI9_9HELO|nr:hypothetical protein BJ875DRAFT_486248 [Amylocarpus encephaloides]